jgi:DMSO/TMAO reductase YedYZ molybdopterin-dependent catalytic subunit
MKLGRLFLLLAISTIVLSGCLGPGLVDSETGVPLREVEVRNYEGENLSSVNDFRENSIKGPQYVDRETYRLEVKGLVEEPKTYSYGELLNGFQSYKKVVTLNCVEGWSAKILWDGILVRDLINGSKAKESASTVIFRAYDGYSTSFPIEYLMENDIIIAYKMNGIELPPERGFPFQLVAESRWGYKWIKWVTEIELSSNENYEGYWESRGYSNTGDLDKSFVGG